MKNILLTESYLVFNAEVSSKNPQRNLYLFWSFPRRNPQVKLNKALCNFQSSTLFKFNGSKESILLETNVRNVRKSVFIYYLNSRGEDITSYLRYNLLYRSIVVFRESVKVT